MIRFLFGRPGSGKTYTVMHEITARVTAEACPGTCPGPCPGSCTGTSLPPVYLIVPEQQAFTAERELLSSLPPEATGRVSVLSFTRLCDTLADRFGGRSQHSINRAMRSLLMWENLRELKGILETYAASTSTDPALGMFHLNMMKVSLIFLKDGITRFLV